MTSRVLIVDDSLTVRMDLDEAFRTGGFETRLCGNAAAARAALADGTYCLVVLDVLLPDADGVELLREIKGQAPVPVMLLSSEAEVRDRVRGLTTGADEYVGKPYEASYLVGRARELVRPAQPAASSGQKLVLVIDDSATSRESLRQLLEEAGFVVLTAQSGEEGLRLAVDRRPDAVVVDGVLPGIDGPTVLRRLRGDAALRRTPCLLLTGSQHQIDELRALEAGADAYLLKDADGSILVTRLAALLRGPGAARAKASSSLLGPKRILAVDDSDTYLQELAAQLRGEGYEVALARSGSEALELLAVASVDCVLLDLVMPGLAGEQTCRRIRSLPSLRDLPIIMLTGQDSRAAMIDGINAGADDFISKSGDFDVLRARLRAQLRRKQFEDESRRMSEDLLRAELDAAEARSARKVADARAALLADLESKNAELVEANGELEAFSYSVSHDLRAPLRGIDGFSMALLEDCREVLDATGKDHLNEIRSAAQRMGELIDDLLQLSRLGRADLVRQPVDLSALALELVELIRASEPQRQVNVEVAAGLTASADPRLLRAALDNLLANAWKFTSGRPDARIEVGAATVHGETVFRVRDNGVGFDPAYGGKLFRPFQRLHSDSEFKGSGIGLAIVQRVVRRHGGRVWAESVLGKGASFFFTL